MARIASHASVAAVGAGLGGGSIVGAVGGTVAGDEAGNVVNNALGNNPTLAGTLLANIASGAAGAIAGGALGGPAGALSGANGASSADLYNRQLHPEERTLIANAANEIAASQGQNPVDQAQIAAYWNNMLTLVANADVDAQGQQQLNQTVSQMTLAAQASGNYQDLQTFQQNLATAQNIIQGMSGQTITNVGGPIVADDGVLKTFQPTGSQYNDSSLFGTPGGTKIGLASGETPASVGIGSQFYIAPNGPTSQQVSAFVSDLIQQAATPNGAVTPVYPLESVVLGNVASKIAAGALDAVLGDGAATAIQSTATTGAGPATTRPVDSLFGQTLNGPLLSHTIGLQDGTLGETVGLQTVNEETGLNFAPLQNNSGNGADGVAIDPNTQTVWVAEVKSSQNGVGAAATAQGDPASKLENWVQSSQESVGTWTAQPSGNVALANSLQKAIDAGYQVKGIQVQVGLPAPGTTGATQISIQPWLPKSS